MLSSFRLCQSLLVGHRYPISATMSSSPSPPPSGTDFSSSCKRDRPRVIATHSGSFHCDEALACWLLRRTPEFADASILRTRDLEKIAEADIAVDVGAEYDPARNRFDHHQRGFEETFSPQHSIKLSSAGLVYKHFGKSVVAEITKYPEEDARCELIWLRLYDSFIMALDGIDNGVPQFETELTPRYKITTDLASRVGRLNPSWSEPGDEETTQRQFLKAVALAGGEFEAAVVSFQSDWFLARELVREAFETQATTNGSGDDQVLVLPRACPWKGHLFDYEEEKGLLGRTKYVVYSEHATSWRVQAVPKHISVFGDRLSLPEAWRGVRDQQLSDLTGVPGCIFVHASGFIGGASSKEAALRLAKLSLQLQQ